MNVFLKNKSFIKIICVIIVVLLIPFNVSKANYSGSEITLYKSVLYTVVRVEIMDIRRTKIYWFPSNFDANNNFEVLNEQLVNMDNLFNNLFK